jgi:PAS domain S-box-containing protein/TyrR family helix-turn-helix protein
MESKPSHEEILNASRNGVVATDSAGVIVFANTRFSDLLGIDATHITGSAISDALPSMGPLVAKSLATEESQLGLQVPARDGTLMLNITLIRDGGKTRGTVCSLQPAELLERSAQKLESYKNLNRQLNAIIQSSSDGIWVCDGQARVTTVNEASEKLNGITAASVVGKHVSEIMAGGLFDRSVTLEVLKTGRQVSLFQQIKDTGRLLLVTGTPVFDESGNIFLVVVNERDMTQLDAIRGQLEQSRLVTEKYRDELAELTVLELQKQEIIAEHPTMRHVLRMALKLAHLQASNILILGESGTGKGLLAKFIHKNGHRSTKPLIQINCAALPETLLEAELFGYERGAFTGASEQGKAGLFELAQGGTLLLDEIGDLPLPVQAKLLKYLDDHEVLRLGSLKPRKIDCTVIAATNRDLEQLTRDRLFRQDLYYRLNTFTVRIPPLRDRGEDLFELTSHFLQKYNRSYKVRKRVSPAGLESLQSYSFPGNVRELKSLLKKAAIMSDKDLLDEFIAGCLGDGSAHARPVEAASVPANSALNEAVGRTERDVIERALKQCRSTRELARQLGISQPTVVRRLKKYGLAPPGFRNESPPPSSS